MALTSNQRPATRRSLWTSSATGADGTVTVLPDAVLVAFRACVVLMLVALWAVVAFGEVSTAGFVAGVSLVAALVVGASTQWNAIRAAAVAGAATSVSVLALVVAPVGHPALRAAIVAAAVLPFLAASPGWSTWWQIRADQLRTGGLAAVGMAAAVGLALGVATGVAHGPLIALDALSGWAVVGGSVAVLAAAVVEEVLHRGVLLDGLGGGPVAIGLTALVGAVAATATGHVALVTVVALGAVALGALRAVFGSLWFPVLARVVAAGVLVVGWGWSS